MNAPRPNTCTSLIAPHFSAVTLAFDRPGNRLKRFPFPNPIINHRAKATVLMRTFAEFQSE
jgi:hypothetical protein